MTVGSSRVAEGSPDFLIGGGETGALMRAHDWSLSPLGQPSEWPQSLRSALSICLGSGFQIAIYWGESLSLLYNDAWSPILGLKHPYALGKPATEVWPEIWDTIGPLFETVFATGEAIRSKDSLLAMHRHGFTEECYFDYTFSPIRNEQGKVGGIFNAVVETTFRVVGERQSRLLRQLGEQLANAQSASEAIRIATHVLGTDPADIPFALIYTRESPEANKHFRLASTVGPHFAADALQVHWQLDEVCNTRAPVIAGELSSKLESPIFGSLWPEPCEQAMVFCLGEAAQAGALVAGISPRLIVNDEYRTFLTSVASVIGAAITRGQALEQERLRAQAIAEIDRAKTVFFSNVSHEFRTPLTLMIGPIEDALSHSDISASVRSQLDVAHRNAQRLLKLVNSLLEFSRIEAGRIQASFSPTDLAALTVDLASTFRSAMQKANLQFDVDCEPMDQPVYVDREMWEKIVLNLLSNAFKFTLKGSIKIGLAREDGMAVLEVSDTGVGVPELELPRLFDRFHRVEGAQARTHEGSGIGLALVHELVKLHGGSVEASSRLGEGSTFRVRLPLGIAHVPAERIREPSAGSRTATDAHAYAHEALRWLPDADRRETVIATSEDLGNQDARFAKTFGSRVLLADDNADMRNYIRDLLTPSYEVRTAADGRDALAMAREARPDLILSDVMMPNLDGFGLLNELRRDDGLREVPIILLSARAGEESRIEGLNAGADDYIVKPFNARELLTRVGAILELTALRREEQHSLEVLNRAGSALAVEPDLHRLVQIVTDAGVEISGAQFGAFFYNLLDERGESYTLYTLSGAPPEAFSKFPMPRNTDVFAPTFMGTGIVRSDDITQDARYGRNAPRKGMPEGHLPVRSYLAVPVISRSGKVLGGLFFGHAKTGVFTERSERGMSGLASQAAVAIDNANLAKERTRAEEALRDLNANLEREIAERTEQLRKQEETLRQVQKMEAVGQLTGGVAHDFNNLLQVIVGNLDVIKRVVPTDSGRIQRAAEQAMNGAKQASALTQRLLAFSRRQPLDPKPTDINSLVGGMSDLLERTLGETISVETVRSAGLWKVEVDPNALESAILNLAVNARDAMPDGGRLTIETMNTRIDSTYAAAHAEIAPGQYVALSVSDSGTGMNAKTLERAFEPFFTTKAVGKGTGLGLSQVYGFTKQSGGHVKIYSEEGHGTTVKLYLPRLENAHDEPAPHIAAPIPEGTHEETILVVEDDANVRAYSVDALRELGYRVLEAPDGPSALRILDVQPRVDLLFTDVVLPSGMTGDQVAARARSIHPTIKVLFTTGYARDAIFHHGRLDKGVQLLTKPFNFSDLAEKVRDVLDGLPR